MCQLVSHLWQHRHLYFDLFYFQLVSFDFFFVLLSRRQLGPVTVDKFRFKVDGQIGRQVGRVELDGQIGRVNLMEKMYESNWIAELDQSNRTVKLDKSNRTVICVKSDAPNENGRLNVDGHGSI